jgi:undecaprenyl phosphate N,N'-diacetylbacillosamine 1-phosphate transferase
MVVLVPLAWSGSPFFTQPRIGRNGRLFTVLKLRTMTARPHRNEAEVHLDDPEVTPLGRLLRRFKIDELPQLLNVLFGQMSLVGPRPCLPSLRDRFNSDADVRLSVRPGLTGLAQVNGNIHLTWEERWKYDREYVETLSFGLDVKIILRTCAVLVAGEKRALDRSAP